MSRQEVKKNTTTTKKSQTTKSTKKNLPETSTSSVSADDLVTGTKVKITKLWANAPEGVHIGLEIMLTMVYTIYRHNQLLIKTGFWRKTEGGKGEIYQALEVPISCISVVSKAKPSSATPTKASTYSKNVNRYGGYSTYYDKNKPKKKCEYEKLDDKQKYFADLVMAKTRKEVIDLALEGVDIDLYDFYMDKKDDTHEYLVMVPKKKTSSFFPMLMAHTDVHPSITSPDKETLLFEDGVFAGQKGLGADDRAGIYTINQVLRQHPGKFIIGFFDKEEVGCVGSNKYAASEDFKKINKWVSAYISIDRRRGTNGHKAIALYGSNNDALNKLVKEHIGRDTVNGSTTDCAILSRKSGVLKEPKACFNFSCGYENEHRASETLHWKELEETVVDVANLTKIEDLWKKEFPFTVKSYSASSYGGYSKRHSSSYYYDTELGEYLVVNREVVEETDVKIMMDLLHYFTGTPISMKKLQALSDMYIIGAGETVMLDPNATIGQKNGGKVLSASLFDELKVGTWFVETVDKDTLRIDLISEDAKIRVYNVPMQWLTVVDTETTYIEYL